MKEKSQEFYSEVVHVEHGHIKDGVLKTGLYTAKGDEWSVNYKAENNTFSIISFSYIHVLHYLMKTYHKIV